MTDQDKASIRWALAMLKKLEPDVIAVNETLAPLPQRDPANPNEPLLNAYNISGGAWSALRQTCGWLLMALAQAE